jgi:hypothetical protein
MLQNENSDDSIATSDLVGISWSDQDYETNHAIFAGANFKKRTDVSDSQYFTAISSCQTEELPGKSQ